MKGGKRYWSVMVACNDWRTGSFAGRAGSVDILAPEGEVAAGFATEDKGGRPLKFFAADHAVRFGRGRIYLTLGSSTWHGNWCWNRYWLDDATAARLLRMLWKNFPRDEGLCDLIDRIEAGDRVTSGLLRELAERWERA